jgi:hypothetical protein
LRIAGRALCYDRLNIDKEPVVLDKSSLRANPHLYEINTLPWLHELSLRLARPVTLGNVPASEWDCLRDRGFDLVWLMGIWKRSRQSRLIARQTSEILPAFAAALPEWTVEDVVGSAFSVQCYEPDPAVGTWEDLKEVRRRLHERGMLLVLDFVGNHTAPDHPWVGRHPDYYLLGSPQDYQRDPSLFEPPHQERRLSFAYGKDPYFPPWTDTLQLNHFNPETRLALLEELRTISQYCDGLRCDMAMLALNRVFAETWASLLRTSPSPTEFWADATSSLPSLLWIAESYWGTEQELLELGFDYVYDKVLSDRLRYLESRDLQSHLSADPHFQERLVRFIENHDEPRSAEVFPADRLRAAVLLFSTLPGMRFYYHGQLQGARVRLPVQLRRYPPELEDPALEALYRRILDITRHKCFHEGNWQLLPVGPAGDAGFADLVAYSWRIGETCKLVVVNFSLRWAQGRVGLPDFPSGGEYLFFDELSERSYVREGAEISRQGLHCLLDPFSGHLFDVSPR